MSGSERQVENGADITVEYYPTALWPALIEKAYAAFAEQHGLGGQGNTREGSGYDLLNDGRRTNPFLQVAYGPDVVEQGTELPPEDGSPTADGSRAVIGWLLELGRSDGKVTLLHTATHLDRQRRALLAQVERVLSEKDEALAGEQALAKLREQLTSLADPPREEQLRQLLLSEVLSSLERLCPRLEPLCTGSPPLQALCEHMHSYHSVLTLNQSTDSKMKPSQLVSAHEYAILGATLVDLDGKALKDAKQPIDAERSTVQLHNPHGTNVPTFSQRVGPGLFTLSLAQLLRHFSDIERSVCTRS
jgi:hypothetical protein